MPDSSRRFSFRLLASGAFALAVAAIFLIGFELGGGALGPGTGVTSADSLRVHLLEERNTLGALLAESERQRMILERAAQIDKEAFRLLQERLTQAQDARLELSRESSYLKRLVQEDGKGAIQVYDMRLTPGEEARAFLYSFTVTQLVQGVGRSQGEMHMTLEGMREDERVSLDLEQLPEAHPKALIMDFEHFQNFQGRLEVPSDFTPTAIVIAIKPTSKLLLTTSVMFPWEPSSQ